MRQPPRGQEAPASQACVKKDGEGIPRKSVALDAEAIETVVRVASLHDHAEHKVFRVGGLI
jgi:hypothetical protein